MGVFDFLAAAKMEAEAKVVTLQKKIEETAEQLSNSKLPTITKKAKPACDENKRKTHKPKRDPSIQDISTQIIKQRDNIVKNGFNQYEFIANKNCCEICAMLNGRHFPISNLIMGVNAPPMHEGCKCSIAAYEDNEDYEAWLDSLNRGGTTKL